MGGAGELTALTVSVIIPALNEERQIAGTLKSLERHVLAGKIEAIIIDGNSEDRTVEAAKAFGWARVMAAERANRGLQMNAGARHAGAETLLFLHADARLPDRAIEMIEEAMKNERICGGCFQLKFPGDASLSLRLVEWGINLRTRWLKTATGDQGVFIRKRVFDEIGGYQNIPLMEDIALFNKMKERAKVAILNEKIEISPRRWLKHGVWKTVLLMYVLRIGYWLGVPPAKLKSYFVDVR